MAGYIGSKAVITSGVSASIDELNLIDGVTATTAELNILDGVTSTAAELNILDGVTSTAAELNILDGVTATATELNLIDGVTATTAELNILDGVTTTAAELNLIDGGTARGTTAIVDADGVLVNDAGTMRMTTVATLATYMGTKGLGPTYTRQATAPSSPNAGDWWNNTNNDSLYIYDATDGWITNTLHDFGSPSTGRFQVPGNFSVLQSGSIVSRVSFQGAGIGTGEPSAYANAITTDSTAKSFGLSNSIRGLFGNFPYSGNNVMAFITMATNAAAADFGDMVVSRSRGPQSTSHATRGIIAGGHDASAGYLNQMDYVTIANTGNATDFGNLSVSRRELPSQAMSTTVRSVFGGGYTGSVSNVLDYVTIASTGNATDFGNLGGDLDGKAGACVNNTTRGIIGGNATTATVTMEYITIGTTGNSTDFGDLTATSNFRTAVHSSTKAFFANSNQIVMATAGNATATGFTHPSFGTGGTTSSVMPGWLAYNG